MLQLLEGAAAVLEGGYLQVREGGRGGGRGGGRACVRGQGSIQDSPP